MCTPDHEHYEIAKACLQANKHLLLEKPIATTREEAGSLVQLAETGPAKLMPGHTLRFDSRYYYAWQTQSSGRLGAPVHVYARRNNTRETAHRIQGRTSVTMFLGVHDLDALMWITGSRIVSVSAVASHQRVPGTDSPLSVGATLTFESGAMGLLECSWALPEHFATSIDARLELVSEQGAIYVDVHEQGIRLFDGRLQYPHLGLVEQYGIYVGALKEELAAFVDGLGSDGPLPVTARDGYEAVLAALAIDESIRLGQPVKVKDGSHVLAEQQSSSP